MPTHTEFLTTRTLLEWGRLTLGVSPASISTFVDFERKNGYKFDEKDASKKKPRLDLKNPEGEEVSFTAYLSVDLGVDPRATYEKWVKECNAGKYYGLRVGGRQVGTNKFIISSLTMGDCIFGVDGALQACNMSVDMRETGTRETLRAKSVITATKPVLRTAPEPITAARIAAARVDAPVTVPQQYGVVTGDSLEERYPLIHAEPHMTGFCTLEDVASWT